MVVGPRDAAPRFPACERCRIKKIKCDRKAPKCSNCLVTKAECLLIDSQTKAQYSRQYIAELEDRTERLQGCLHSGPPIFTSTSETSPRDAMTASDNVPLARPQGTAEFRYTGKGSGLDFLKSLFADADWRATNAQLLRDLGRPSGVAEGLIQPNALPSFQEAEALVENFLNGPHAQCPGVYRHQILSIFHHAYQDPGPAPITPIDTCQLYLVFAIGAVSLYRSKRHLAHPIGYYRVAMQHVEGDFLAKGLEAIQCLLLVARFAVFYHIGISVWDISQTCIRMCVELELHLRPDTPISAEVEQLQRRIFWQSYIMDRYSSVTLGRPFAIAEADIQVEMPADLRDEDLLLNASTLDEISVVSSPQLPTRMSMYRALIRLRRISSNIYYCFFRDGMQHSATRGESSLLESGRIYLDLNRFLSELDQWHREAPSFPQPSCLYEHQEWYAFLHKRERLLLVRQVIDSLPQQTGRTPRDLLRLCQQCAMQVIVIYRSLYQQGYIEYTRSYFSTLFTAGLSVMCCMEIFGTSVMRTHAAIVAEGTDPLEAIAYCHQLLSHMGSELHDVNVYIAVFRALRQKLEVNMKSLELAEDTIQAHHPQGPKGQDKETSTMRNRDPSSASNPLTAPDEQWRGSAVSADHLPIAYNFDPQDGSRTSATNVNPSAIPPSEHVLQDNSQILEPGGLTSWDQDIFWNMNMETGLNEYVYGDMNVNSFLTDRLDMDPTGW